MALLLALVVPLRADDADSERPNFVIILADDLGYGDLSCYGNEAYETPHLDRMAREGLRFTDFHSSAPVCSPTRAGLLTGRYQQRAGVPGVIFAGFDQNRHHGLHTHERTFAELLDAAGYATGCFGKWHLGYDVQFNPIHHGFDRFRGYVSGNIDYHSHHDRMGVPDWWHDTDRREVEGYSTHLITAESVRFIEENKARPFLAYVAHEAPHTPFQGPDDPPFRVTGKIVREKRSPEHKERAYREMVQELDRGVGEILATLKRLELDSRTLVLFFSDNGATRVGSNGSLRGHKGQLWEGGHRVPAIAWWPGTITAGQTNDSLAISLDLMPTMLELAGVDAIVGHELDGRSLSSVLLEGKRLEDRELFWAYGRQRAVRDGKWKLTVNLPGLQRPGLFELESDPSESHNVAAEHRERVDRLLKALSEWEEEVARGATRQPARPAEKKGGGL